MNSRVAAHPKIVDAFANGGVEVNRIRQAPNAHHISTLLVVGIRVAQIVCDIFKDRLNLRTVDVAVRILGMGDNNREDPYHRAAVGLLQKAVFGAKLDIT